MIPWGSEGTSPLASSPIYPLPTDLCLPASCHYPAATDDAAAGNRRWCQQAAVRRHRGHGPIESGRCEENSRCRVGPVSAGEAPASEAWTLQTMNHRGLMVPILSDHQVRLHRRRANTSPHDSPRARRLSGSVPRSKMMQSRIQQRRTIEPAFHRREPKTSGVDRRLSWVDWRRVRVCHAPRH